MNPPSSKSARFRHAPARACRGAHSCRWLRPFATCHSPLAGCYPAKSAGQARFCYLALHKGEWAGKRIVPESYHDFVWTPSKVKNDEGDQWWTFLGLPEAPTDLVIIRGKDFDNGWVVPGLDLMFVRHGDGQRFTNDFERDLVLRVLAAVEK